MLEILRHWNPYLRQSKINKNVYILSYCPVCKYDGKTNRCFRYNIRLKIIKCYECDMAANVIRLCLIVDKIRPNL